MGEFKAYLQAWPYGRFVDDVRYRIGKMYERQGDARRAVLWYLKVPYLTPESLRLRTARVDAAKLFTTSRDLKKRRLLYKSAFDAEPQGQSQSARHRAYVEALLRIGEPKVLTETVVELRRYLALYPDAVGNDVVLFKLAELLQRNREYRPAIVAYQKLAHVYSESDQRAQARLRSGDITWRFLARPFDALRFYERLARDQPGLSESGTALFHMGQIEQTELKRFELAMRYYDDVVENYPNHLHAHDALMAKAAIYLKKYADNTLALASYAEAVRRYPDDSRSARALELSGRVYEKQVIDIPSAIDQYVALARSYPRYIDAAKLLYHAGRLADKKLMDTGRAKSLYRELVDSFPHSPEAGKARRRLSKLNSP